MTELERVLTDFDAVVSEEKTGQDHLTHTKARAKGGEEGDGGGAEEVDEEDGQKRVDESQVEDGDC